AFADVAHRIGGLQRLRQVGHGQSVGAGPARVERYRNDTLGRADRGDVAGAADGLERGLQGVRASRQLAGAALRIVRPYREAHHRNVIDALGLDQRLADAHACRQPVLVREHLVVQAYDRRLAFDADGELDGQHSHTWATDRIHVLDA